MEKSAEIKALNEIHDREMRIVQEALAEARGALADTEHEAEAAIALLKRGQKALNRVGWEPGETDQEWLSAVSTFVGAYEMSKKIEAQMQKAALKEGGKG